MLHTDDLLPYLLNPIPEPDPHRLLFQFPEIGGQTSPHIDRSSTFLKSTISLISQANSRISTLESHLPRLLLDAITEALRPINDKLSSLTTSVESLSKPSTDSPNPERSQWEMDLGDFALVPHTTEASLASLHSKFDKAFYELGFKLPAVPEGEKTAAPPKLPSIKKLSSNQPPPKPSSPKSSSSPQSSSPPKSSPPKDASASPTHTGSTEKFDLNASVEGEQSSKAPEDRGKRTLSAEELAREEKKKKDLARYGARPKDAEILKLKPASQPITTELGLSAQEIEEARIAQIDLDKSRDLSLKAAAEEATKVKSTDAIQTQKSVLSALEQEKNEEISWYKKTMHHRSYRSQISSVKIATSKANPQDIRLIINWEDGSMKSVKESHLQLFGLSEWYEISQHLVRSPNPKKDIFVKYIDGLMGKMKEFKRKHNITLSTDERAKLQSLKEKVILPKVKNPPDSVFKEMAREGKIPNVNNLNLTIPTSVPYPTTTLSLSPIPGLFFNDGLGRRAFFRFAQIPFADTIFLEGIHNLFPNIPEAQPFYRNLLDEIKRRKTSKK